MPSVLACPSKQHKRYNKAGGDRPTAAKRWKKGPNTNLRLRHIQYFFTMFCLSLCSVFRSKPPSQLTRGITLQERSYLWEKVLAPPSAFFDRRLPATIHALQKEHEQCRALCSSIYSRSNGGIAPRSVEFASAPTWEGLKTRGRCSLGSADLERQTPVS